MTPTTHEASNVFLTDAQVRRLTGEREKEAQIRWLDANRIRHWINASGKPIVPCCEIEAAGSRQIVTGSWTPDFSKIAAQ